MYVAATLGTGFNEILELISQDDERSAVHPI